MKNILPKNRMIKRLYFTVAVALLAVSASAVVSGYTADKLKENIPEISSSFVSEENVADEYKELSGMILNNTEDEEDEEDEEVTEESLITKSTEEGSIPETTKASEEETVKASASFSLPLTGEIMKRFSLTTPQYDSTMKDYRVHKGIDIKGQEGEEVLSCGDGKVSKVYVDRIYGYVIEVDYGSFTGRYCGISQTGAVGIGDKVKKGSVIGTLTFIPCETEDGVHLHFEAVKDGALVDPEIALG